MIEIHRFGTRDELAQAAATALLETLVSRQRGDHVPQLALSGGRIANRVYAALAEMVPGSGLDPARLEMWWSDEYFLPTDDPERNAGASLALLARAFPVDPAHTHPMPSAHGVSDNTAAAEAYAKELGDTRFDVCLLGLGADGHVASIFPGDASFEPTAHTVIAVSEAPTPPAERISLSMETICASDEVWFFVSGAEKAQSLRRALADDQTIPAGVARGTSKTVVFADAEATAALDYYDCAF